MKRVLSLLVLGVLSIAAPGCGGSSGSGGASSCAEMIERDAILTMEDIDLCDHGGYTCEGDGSSVFTTIDDSEVDESWLLVEGRRPTPYQDENLWDIFQELCPGASQ